MGPTPLQAVRYIVAFLWKRERFGMLFTLIFALYIGGIISLTVDELLGGEGAPESLNGLVDWMYLMMFPGFGLVMNRTTFGMWRGDVYSKRIAHWRSLPIPLSSIIQARLLQSSVMVPIIGAAYILLQYLLSPNLREALSTVQMLENWIVWVFYSYILNALFVLIELGYSGKRYVQFYFAIMGFTAIVTAILTWQGCHVFESVLQLTADGHAWVAIIPLLILAILATWAGYHITLHRLRVRSITF
jgi:hypothetical protein